MPTTKRYEYQWACLIRCILLHLLSSDSTVTATFNSQNSNNPNNKSEHTTIQKVNDQDNHRILSSYHNFCGVGFQDASTACQYPCPSGSIDECPPGMLCYFNTECSIKDHLVRPTRKPTPAPTSSSSNVVSVGNDNRPIIVATDNDLTILHNFCGTNWLDASTRCSSWCPGGDDTECPSGESCFGDTACTKTMEPTNQPTGPLPTSGPSLRPVGPTVAPTVGMIVDQPSNHQFCGYEYTVAIDQCSLETHCPNGEEDCTFPASCWHGLKDCDVRDFIPHELGGFLDRPSQKELAKEMGLTYPSDNPTDHYFCGVQKDDINKRCNTKPCPDGTSANCDYGQTCFRNTACDARIIPGYGITQSPSMKPTLSPLISNAREYFSFCGEDWAQANTCKMQWCGDGSKCPNGQTCFANTECNMKEKLDAPPTKRPTESPVTYMDESNFRFCGKTYLDAVAKCSVDSYCKSGTHEECRGGEFCWQGVSCNIIDVSQPTPYRPPTSRPSVYVAPLPRDDPSHTSFCGLSFDEARSQCSVESHCSSGLHQDCPAGLFCWVGACNILDFTSQPTEYPSVVPSYTPSSSPTSSPVKATMAPITARPTFPPTYPSTQSPTLYSSTFSAETTQTKRWCGLTLIDAARNCGKEGYECPYGLCPNSLKCFMISTSCQVESDISDDDTSSPTPLKQTISPTLQPSQTPTSVFSLSISSDTIPKSPDENILRVQNIIESAKPALRTEIFVLQTRGGALIKSSLYNYKGFLSAFTFYANVGVNGNYFYLGGKQTVDEQMNLEVEFGIVNLALFIAKLMTDTIPYESCKPDLLACGLGGLNTIFETEQHRFMCPASSNMTGVECQEERVGCACIFGFLNKHIGVESNALGKYSGQNFCDPNDQSLCSRSAEGSELRWLTAMSHWVLVVQRREENGWIFIEKLKQFVSGGMIDMNFLDAVAEISVLDNNHISDYEISKADFVENFFKVMIKLSETHSGSQTVSPSPTTQPTTAPVIMFPSIDESNQATIIPSTPQLQSKPPFPKPSLNEWAFGSPPSKAPLANLLPTSQPDTFYCPNFCAEVASIEKCPSRDITVPLTVSYCSPEIGINEMCRGNGYCGTSANLDNCGKGRSIYNRIDCSPPEVLAVDDGGVTNSPTSSDRPCSLCPRPDEVAVDSEIVLYKGKQSSCEVVQSFLQQSVNAGDAVCSSAQEELAATCCETKLVELANNETVTDAEEFSNQPTPAPIQTIEPTRRGADLPWYTKYLEGQSRSSGVQSGYRQSKFWGMLTILISVVCI